MYGLGCLSFGLLSVLASSWLKVLDRTLGQLSVVMGHPNGQVIRRLPYKCQKL